MRKKLLSIALAIVVILAALPYFSTPSFAALSVSEVKAQITDTYQKARSRNGGNSFDGWCGAYVGQQLQILGINTTLVAPNGNGHYDAYTGLSETTGGYKVTCYPASSYSITSALNAITANGNAYNILIGFEKGYQGNTLGHCLFIHAIIDGTVYYSESFAFNSYGEGSVIAQSISWVDSFYARNGYTLDGVVYFSKSAGVVRDEYPSYATLEVTKQTPMHSLPCSNLTDSSSERICTWTVGKRLTATGLYRNTAGNYWYGVTDPDSGKEGYVFAGEVRVKELLWDATITGADYPEELSLGSRFWIKGTVSTRYTGLQTVTGSILKNGTVRYTCSVNTTSAFSLLNSKIDDALCFNELEAGGYNYLVSAKCRNYYATDGTTLASPETKTITVHSNYFSVGGHVHAYTIEEHEAAHPHRCYKRCSCGDYQYTGKTAYVNTCEECTKYSGTCGADGDNLTWKLNRDTGELTISGTGYMKDYDSASKTPWYEVRDEIKTVTVGSGATDVGAYAFSGCSSLTGVTLPDSLTAIRRHAFSESSLKEVSIPENVTLIGEHAFWNTSMYNITVPKKVSSIGAGAFSKGLMQAIFVDEENQYYTSENGVLYNKDKTLLHTYLKFTSSGTKYGSKNVAYIPDTVTEIGDEAFYDFRGEEIHMGSSVQTIGRDAFARCDNLETILLPASVSAISTLAFCDSGLKTVYCEGSAPTFGHCIFPEFPDKATLYCKEDIDGWRTLASDEWNSYLLKEMLGLGENAEKTMLTS